jgi:hypothetical protein
VITSKLTTYGVGTTGEKKIQSRTRAGYMNGIDVDSDWYWIYWLRDYKHDRSQSLGTLQHWQFLKSFL